MVPDMSAIKCASVALVLGSCALAGLSTTASAQSRYDGAWSVLIITDAGDCDRAYRYGLRIEGGRVYHDRGGAGTQGRVTSNGQVTVTVRQGSSYANGTGRLTRTSGSGRWKGASSTSRCSGHWQAERR
jgi:hypothetical protein